MKGDTPIEILERTLRSLYSEMATADNLGDTAFRERLRDLAFDVHKAIRLLEDKFYANQSLSSALKCILIIGSTISFGVLWFLIVTRLF